MKTHNNVEQLQFKFHFLTSFQDLGGNVGPVLQNGHNLFITLHTCRHVKKWFHGITANMAVIYHAVYTMTHIWWITETCTLTSTQISTHYHNNLYFLLCCWFIWFSLHLWTGCDTFKILFTYLTHAFYIPEDGHMVGRNI